MNVVIAGGHGQIALILERLLSARGDSVAGFIRNPQQIADLEAAGADALVVDLEKASVDEVAEHLRGADAVVFAAGAGPGSGAARKETVDRDAAILLADAAEAAGVDRYVMVSAMAADPQATADDEVFQAYLRAKGVADEAIRSRAASELDHRAAGSISPMTRAPAAWRSPNPPAAEAFPALTSRRCSSRCSMNRAPQAEAST